MSSPTCLFRRQFTLLSAIGFLVLFAAQLKAADPITEQSLTTLLQVGIDDATIAAKVKSSGIDFTVDDDVITRLKNAGASDAVLQTVRAAGVASKPAGPAITFQQVVTLYEVGISEDQILQRLENSPTIFTLDAQQVQLLKSKGASDRIIQAMQAQRGGSSKAKEISDFVMILDCSGSMSEQTPDGQTKMAAAQQALTELIQKMPESLYVSLVIYGHDKQQACKAVKVVRPLSELTAAGKSELIRYIQQLRPAGNTPIALALETAGQELSKAQGAAGLYLITDGKETCYGDPVAVATKLAQNHQLAFGINVIGFGLNEGEREAVRVIAEKGNGEFFDAQNLDDLKKILEKTVPIPEPVVVTPRKVRGLKVLAPTELKLPDLSKIIVAKAGGWTNRPEFASFSPILESPSYGRELKISSADESYDIIWQPKEGMSVRMMAGVKFEKEEMLEVRPEDYLGLVKLTGNGLPKPKKIGFSAPDAYGLDYPPFDRRGQIATAYGETFIVPAGEWDLWIKPADGSKAYRLEQKVTIEPGKLNVIE